MALKEYKCELPDDILNDFKEYIKKINKQLFEEFNNKDYGYTVDIKTSFFKKYKSELSDDNLDNFIIWFNKQNNNKGLKRLACGLIQVAPTDNIIQSFLSNEFDNKDCGYEVDIKKKFFETYNCKLADDILDRFVKNFNSTQYNKMILMKDEKYILITANPDLFIEILESNRLSNDNINNLMAFSNQNGIFHQVLAELIQCKFLSELVGYSCSVNEIINLFKDEYSISSIKNEDVVSAIQIANQNLKDIKIIENDGILKSSFKDTNMGYDNYNIKVCPICGEKFDGLNFLQIKTHILGLHTSKNPNCSILAEKSDSEFYCNQCKEKHLALYNNEVRYQAIYHHLFGLCKNPTPPKLAWKSNIEFDKGIWKGFSYANDSAFLGNSGQLLRDNGRFGSYPIEDNLD